MDLQEQVNSLRELLLGVDSKLDRIIIENSDKTIKLNELEASVGKNIAELESRLQDKAQQLTSKLEQMVDERIGEATTRIDDKFEAHMKEVNEQHFRDCENFETLDERINEVFEGDFTPIIDRRVKIYVEELVHNVQLLFDKIELLNRGVDQRAMTSRVDDLRNMLRKMETNMGNLHMEYRRISDELERLVTASTGLEEGLSGLQENLETVQQNADIRVDQVASRVEHLEQAVVDPVASNHRADDDPSWFNEGTMGESTRMGYSLYAAAAKSRKKKKEKQRKTVGSKTKVRHDDDPDSSDSSSSSSSTSDTDESERPRKTRKRDSSSDSEGSDRGGARKRRSSRRWSKVLDTKHFGTDRRRASIIGGDDQSSISSDRGRSRSSRSAHDSIVFVQPLPVVQTLKLSEVTLGKVMYFCKTFNNESSRFRGGLNASNYIEDRLLCQMRQVALKHDLPGQSGILSNGKQKISNRDIFSILAMMCAPTSKEEMQRQLAKSAWSNKNDFKSVDQIMKNIKEYRTEMLIYVDRFEDKLKLLGFHDCSAKYIPKALFKKGGSDPGLADYFIQGMPDKNFGMRVWLSVDEDKRKKCSDWRKFVKLYMVAIDLMEKREKDKEINRQICLGVKEMIKTDHSPKTFKKDSRDSSRVHAMEEQGATEESEEEQEAEYDEEVVFRRDDDNEDLPSLIAADEEEHEADKENIPSLEVTAEDLSQLANLLQPADTKKAGVCYDMLYQGKCAKTNCPYSHKAEDIAQAKKLKTMRIGTSPNSNAKQVSFHKSPNQALRKA